MIQLLSCGYHTVHHDGIVRNRPNGSGSYIFVFFKSRAEVKLYETTYEVDKHTFVLFQPTTPHFYREIESPFINDWFHCWGEELEALLDEIQFPADTPVKASDPVMVSRFIQELQATFHMGGKLKERIIDCELRSFFMKLADLQQRTTHEKLRRYYLPFSELRNELYSNPQNHYTVSQLASRFNLSKSYFQHIYKDLFQCSVMSDMIQARLGHAKYLLDHSEHSISHIASLCGYENETHFMRQFKRYVGVSPRRYRFRGSSSAAASPRTAGRSWPSPH